VVALGKHPIGEELRGIFSASFRACRQCRKWFSSIASWYNRAGVERVMGFCTDREYKNFIDAVLPFEHVPIAAEIQIIEYYPKFCRRETMPPRRTPPVLE
jgi:hypothetical protein